MKQCSNPLQQLCNLLTICRRAGKLILGFDPVREAVNAGTAQLVLLAADASPKTKKETAFVCTRAGLPFLETPVPMDQLEPFFHRKVAVMAVCDAGFSRRFQELLSDDGTSVQASAGNEPAQK